MKSRNLNFLEHSGPLQDCNGTAFYIATILVYTTALGVQKGPFERHLWLQPVLWMRDQSIVCHLFCCMLHSVLLSSRLEFDPQPQQILFLSKCSLICSVVSIAVCTGIHEIWHDCRTVERYTCLLDFNNSVSYNMSIMRISEVEAIVTAFCTWLCSFMSVICWWVLLSRNAHVKLQLSIRQQSAVQFVFCACAEQKVYRQPHSLVSPSVTLRQAARLPVIIKLNSRAWRHIKNMVDTRCANRLGFVTLWTFERKTGASVS